MKPKRSCRQYSNGSSWDFINNLKGLGTQNFKHAALSSGIELLSMNFYTDTPEEHLFSINKAPLTFSFHLSGHGQTRLTHSLTRKTCVAGEPGKAIISFNPESTCQAKILEHQHYRIFNIYISPEQLYLKLDEDLEQVPLALRRVLDNAEQLSCNLSMNMSPHSRMILDQISQCPYQGILRRLYLESKSTELIVRQLWEMSQLPVQQGTYTLHPADEDCIRHAKEILINDMINPPSLKELAKQAGLNESKLKQGFRQVYGTTVFEYFRQYRLNKAKEVLDEGKLNVDETAYLLGFCDTTHFIKSFRNHFNTTPGIYLKNSSS